MKAIDKGLLKTFSKMGISTLQSYRGAQVFEAIGLNNRWSTNISPAPSRASKAWAWTCWRAKPCMHHEYGFRPRTESETELAVGGDYRYRVDGEYHLLNPQTVSKLQHAVRQDKLEDLPGIHRSDRQAEQQLCTLRGLMQLKELEASRFRSKKWSRRRRS